MKNRNRTLALLLSLVLALSLCACKPGEQADSSDPPSASPDPSAAPTIEVDLTQDAVAFSAGLSPADVLLTVNGEDIPADLFLYWLFGDCYNFEYYYYYYGVTVADFADALLEDTMDMAAYYTVMRQRAAQLGCLPTDAQKQEVTEELMADGQAYYDSLRTAYGLSEESMTYLTTISCYYENLLDATFPTVTDEMLDGFVYQVKHILLQTVDSQNQPLSDDEIAAQRALAEDILSRLQAVEGEELTELFDELMNQYSEDPGLASYPDGYTAVPGDMVPEFEETSLALPIGGLSGIVESSYGYHIILRGEVENIDDYIDDCRTYYLDSELEELMNAAEITRADALLTNLDVAEFYERYFAYQSAVMEEYFASVEGEGSGGGDPVYGDGDD